MRNKTMDKIKKLKPFKEGMTVQYEYDKINEIIDYLNQSQKQPEGVLEEGYRVMAKDKERMENEVALETYKQATTEKQEEWEKEYRRRRNEPYTGKNDRIYTDDEVVDFISQLLSERTFNKEELRRIEVAYSEDYFEGYCGDKTDGEILGKISKLLKEEE